MPDPCSLDGHAHKYVRSLWRLRDASRRTKPSTNPGQLCCEEPYLNVLSRFIILGTAFILAVSFGLWLSRSGRPYNGLLFNVHKLSALAAMIITVAQLAGILKNTDLPTLLSALLALAGLGAVALFVSGALMSAGRLDHALLHTIHRRVALAGMVIALLCAVVLLGTRP